MAIGSCKDKADSLRKKNSEILGKTNHKPTAEEAFSEKHGHKAKNEAEAKKDYNPDHLSEKDKNKQHEAIYLSKHGE